MVCSAGEGVNVPPRLTIEDAGFLAQHPLPQSYLSIPRDERRSTGEVWTWRWYAKLEEGITFNITTPGCSANLLDFGRVILEYNTILDLKQSCNV
jgi:hypothetical protein